MFVVLASMCVVAAFCTFECYRLLYFTKMAGFSTRTIKLFKRLTLSLTFDVVAAAVFFVLPLLFLLFLFGMQAESFAQ